jgi:hypothetical protein
MYYIFIQSYDENKCIYIGNNYTNGMLIDCTDNFDDIPTDLVVYDHITIVCTSGTEKDATVKTNSHLNANL